MPVDNLLITVNGGLGGIIDNFSGIALKEAGEIAQKSDFL